MEANFYKGLMECESRWSLLVFWVPHINQRTLRDKMEEISKSSATKNVHKRAHAQTVERPFDNPEGAFDSSGESVENMRQTDLSGQCCQQPCR